MKILLVVKSKIMENLGVQYLSAVIKRCGGQCKIVDLTNAVDTVIKWNPDMVGMSIMTGSQNEFKTEAHVIRQLGVSKIIVGGAHPTFFPEDCKWADEVVRGEAEEYFSSVYLNSIDEIPWPDRTDFTGMKIRDFISSRGCPHNCGYCYNRKWSELHPHFPKVRIRDAKDVCAEIKHVNPQFAYFQDSCFGLSMKWMEEFALSYNKMKTCPPYHCHLRPKQVTEEMCYYLQSSNCHSIRMALESASDRLRKLMNRPNLDTKNVLMASGELRTAGIKFMIQNILAIPTSTIEDDLSTLEFNIRCKPDYAWSSIFAPYPGTVLGDMCKAEGWYKGDYSDITDSFFDQSVLEFDAEYKEQTYVLQKVFALCVETGYMPKVDELRISNLPKLVHAASRKLGDSRLYRGIL